ncbi:MAG TPA: hypothetical protein PLD43_01920 [Anaerolineae bacterium]|nr:hypothetical protein [Anaerolineae bacterium]
MKQLWLPPDAGVELDGDRAESQTGAGIFEGTNPAASDHRDRQSRRPMRELVQQQGQERRPIEPPAHEGGGPLVGVLKQRQQAARRRALVGDAGLGAL